MNDSKMQIFATRLKELRTDNGMTQKEFAQLIGSSKPTVERWERGNMQEKGPVIILLQMLIHAPEYALQFEILPKA